MAQKNSRDIQGHVLTELMIACPILNGEMFICTIQLFK